MIVCRHVYHQLFRRFYYIPRAHSRSRPPKIRYHYQILGLLPCFYAGPMEMDSLYMLFGAPLITLLRTLWSIGDALSGKLSNYTPAWNSWPFPTRKNNLMKLVEARGPLLKHPFRFNGEKSQRYTHKVPDSAVFYHTSVCFCVGPATIQCRPAECHVIADCM